ncbi:MAG TPA: hypothetical protein ENN67_07800 [Firmicutes bacterium]|nr:hypothetical protein [Bacillota bacterium]
MTIAASFWSYIVSFSMGFILLQGFSGGFDSRSPEDVFLSLTTPPAAFLAFNEDFSSADPDKLLTWIHPQLGLVKNGILLNKSEAAQEFRSGSQNSQSGELRGLNIHFNFGQIVGDSCYQADCWVEYLLRSSGSEKVYRFHNIFVFKIIDGEWYLVQTEYVPSAPGAGFGLDTAIGQSGDVPPELRQFVTKYSDVAIPGINPWPLLIGSVKVSDTTLHPIEGKLMDGRKWTLDYAVSQKKPTVMFFMSFRNASMSLDQFDPQMEFLEGLYDKFGHEKLYIFGVTDESKDDVLWVANSGYNKFAPLLDEGSKMHAALNIDMHPYVVVFDENGVVVAVAKTHRPESWPMIEARIREVLSKARGQ